MIKSIALIAATAVLSIQLGGTAFAADPVKKTVVLVHGAFADGSSWSKVIPLLQAKGLNVVAVQNPLTSLADDVAATKRAIDSQKGDVILVGHSWAGTVITQAGNDDRVKALVYVAAFAPDSGQSTNDLIKNYPTPAGLAHPQVDASGFLTLSPENIAKYFAPDSSAKESNLVAVTQGPVKGSAFDDKVDVAAWKSKPSWVIVTTNDQMIAPKLLSDDGKKLNAKVTSIASSHTPMLSHPKEVANVILDAVKAVK